MKSKKAFFSFLFLFLFFYLSLYTWNERTGVLDRLAARTGLDIFSLVVQPGRQVAGQMHTLWQRYVYLVDLRKENILLRAELDRAALEMALLQEDAARLKRLEMLLHFSRKHDFKKYGSRVIGRNIGSGAVQDTLVIDKGTLGGAQVNMPVITPQGVVGRVYKTGFTASTVLLLTDAESKIAVIGQKNRSQGILTGHNKDFLEVRYIPQNSQIEQGELLVSSGLAGVFPKGLPVARVVSVAYPRNSLFLQVRAEPLVDKSTLEEVLLLDREAGEKGLPLVPDLDLQE